jgi:hypothetical protein
VSLSPALCSSGVPMIIVAIAGIAFGQDAARAAISDELGQLVGPTGGDFIKSILAQSSDPGAGTAATIVGILTVLITASGVFGEMHTAPQAQAQRSSSRCASSEFKRSATSSALENRSAQLLA